MHICVCTRDRLNRSISDGLSAADTFLVTFDNHTTTLRNTVLELLLKVKMESEAGKMIFGGRGRDKDSSSAKLF